LWGPLWKEKNNKLKEFLQGDPYLRPLFGKMFHVWDEDDKLQAWFSYINKVHPLNVDWHISMDNFVLDSKSSLMDFLTTIMKLNK
jgi:hypothetical protein